MFRLSLSIDHVSSEKVYQGHFCTDEWATKGTMEIQHDIVLLTSYFSTHGSGYEALCTHAQLSVAAQGHQHLAALALLNLKSRRAYV